MKILLLKLFGGFLIVSSAIVGYALYTNNSAKKIEWEIVSIEPTNINYRGIELEVFLKASFPKAAKRFFSKIERIEGTLRLADEYPIEFTSSDEIVISDNSLIRLYPVDLLYIESMKSSWDALHQAWDNETSSTEVVGIIEIYYSKKIPLVGGHMQKYTFVNKDVKIIGFDTLKRGLRQLDEFWQKVSQSEGAEEIKNKWNSFMDSEEVKAAKKQVREWYKVGKEKAKVLKKKWGF